MLQGIYENKLMSKESGDTFRLRRGRRYTESDFNRTIEIREREAYRVKTFMGIIRGSILRNKSAFGKRPRL